MATVSGSIVVDCSPEEAFAYSGEPAHGPEWQAGVRHVELETPGPTRLGTRVRERRAVPGLPAARWELTHFQPGARWSLRRVDGAERRTMTFAELDGGAATRVTLELAFEGTGVGAAVARRRAARQIQGDLARLKRRLGDVRGR